MGAEEFKFNIDQGTGSFVLKPGRKLEIGPIEKAVKDAGFGLEYLDLEATGSVRKVGEEAFALHVAGADQDIFLGPGKDEATRKNYETVIQQAGSDKRLNLLGRAHGHVDAGPGMTISTFEIVGSP